MRRAQTETFIPGGTSDFGEGKLDTPDLALVAQAIFADDFEFRVTVIAQVRMDISDMKHRQADAQWPGYSFKRTDEPIRRLRICQRICGRRRPRVLLTSARDLVGLGVGSRRHDCD